MLKLNKSRKKLIIDFLIINLVWITAVFIWDILTGYNPTVEGEIRHNISVREVNDLNLILGGIFLGTIFGFLNLFIKNKQERLRKKSYGRIIFIYSITHILLTILTIFIVGVLSELIVAGEISKETFLEIRRFVKSSDFWRILTFTYIVSAGIILFQIINQKFGPGVLLDLLLGKYRQPKEVKMVFLFMDLKSSTTYAEKLGHVKYSQLIQDCFSDLTLAVNEFDANIYQYIGDEVVLIWPYDDGIKGAKCIKIFFRFKEYLQKRSDHYIQSYGFLPQFKAGINGGTLMAAEVGVIKRSIAYHGDVINTASRIQGLCNSFKEEFLASKLIVTDLAFYNSFNYSFIDNIELKGKKEKVDIYAIKQ
ncbi:adenylate/guanylate cyclase domain-containing protein [Marinifilum breve]|uniref:Adenylate/guanylate cyclase domain-containing protein n=1 Tax=Marinifilum breve TaxID=2184082 RepID=A0A2V3ZV86_9BACT|nr:adenylate/guanylate cyclase domain-containing protein [Marinifilum breve]PXX98976.1 adenylate/guanylate cyclase domain-containing protein [Marinifilum breve]